VPCAKSPWFPADNLLVNKIAADWETPYRAEASLEPLEVRLSSLTYDDRAAILSDLTEAIDRAGGWILERRTTSAHALELRIELQTRALIDMYAAIVGSGVELTREAHLLLAERCTCLQHLRGRDQIAAILTMRLEVTFLGDLMLHDGWMEQMLRHAATA